MALSPSTARKIGPVGTAVRTLGGLGLIYLAGAVDGLPWDVDWYDPIAGFVVLPLIMVAVGLGAILFYGASMPIAACLGQPGCEGTVVSNLVLRRDDQIGCPTLFLIDDAEARLGRGDTTAAR